jgi:hypothetical protein
VTKEQKNANARASYARGKIVAPEQRDVRGKKHGWFGTSEFAAYNNAKSRCTNPNYPNYNNYGGRGIHFYFFDFEHFIGHIGPRPKGLSLDRINNDGHYEPGNVRWATDEEQRANRRRTKKK